MHLLSESEFISPAGTRSRVFGETSVGVKKTFNEYINRFIQSSEDEIRMLEHIMTSKIICKKEHFIEINKVCKKVLFISKGYFRFYHFDANGNEITSDFYFGPCFITSYTSFITGNPSFVNVQAMIDMEVLEFQKSDLYELYMQYPTIERLGRLIAESVAITSEEHLFLLLNQTAEMRYKRLLDRNPYYVNTIPLQYIASYLGITKETLSRMRKSII
ncbi:MAG: Crp/Fnr family transcriptional regulator [Bacteroidales bacterium]|jgi:CRP-like cAMP-binding protein